MAADQSTAQRDKGAAQEAIMRECVLVGDGSEHVERYGAASQLE